MLHKSLAMRAMVKHPCMGRGSAVAVKPRITLAMWTYEFAGSRLIALKTSILLASIG